jgi:transposase-like protein
MGQFVQLTVSQRLCATITLIASPDAVSTITNKVLPLVEAWRRRPLGAVYPILYLDAIHYKLRKDHKIENRDIYIVLVVDLEGYKDVLGHWVGDGEEGAR